MYPLRAKDRVYLDVVVESANNAVRVTLFPPARILVRFNGGYAEYRTLGDPEIARQYRRSFGKRKHIAALRTILCYELGFFIGIEFLLTLCVCRLGMQ